MKLVDQPGGNWEVHDLDNPEWDLFESLIVEQNDHFGFEVLYYRYDHSKPMDTLYGEDQTSQFLPGKRTKITYSPPEESSLVTMFGLTDIEQMNFGQIPVYTFKRDILEDFEIECEEPVAGDVIHFLWNGNSYEVTDVCMEQNIFQGKKFCYELRMKVFRFAEQSDSATEAMSHPKNLRTANSEQVSAWGDNDWIEQESDNIDNYTDVDEKIYGF
jgi:hypothetical protein